MEVMCCFEKDLNTVQCFGKLILERINQHLKLALIKNLILRHEAHIILVIFSLLIWHSLSQFSNDFKIELLQINFALTFVYNRTFAI